LFVVMLLIILLYLLQVAEYKSEEIHFLNNVSNKSEKQKAIIVIFGATGDLAKRKLYPSIYKLVQNGEISDDFVVVGTARRPWTHDVFREKVKESIQKNAESLETDIDTFTSHFYYQSLDVNDDASYQE